MMDFLVLLMVKSVTKCSTTHTRLILASLVGALLSCVIIIFLKDTIVQFITFHVIVNTIIIKIGFKIRNLRKLMECMIALYFSSFLIGGVFQYFSQYLKVGSLFFALSLTSYLVVRIIWRLLSCLNKSNNIIADVNIFVSDRCLRVRALIDTGNSLRDPYANKPVHILQMESVSSLLDGVDEAMLLVRYIPYQTIDSSGTLKAFQASKLQVYGDKEVVIEKPIIAIGEKRISKGEVYQMILNPDIF